jgi:uncharacterized Zn finger protein
MALCRPLAAGAATARGILPPVSWLEVAELADEGSYARGEDYARRGQVEMVAVTDESVSALVLGTTVYDVLLRRNRSSCTCPVNISGAVCKHIVAVALVAAGAIEPSQPAEAEPANDAVPALVDWLAGLTREDTILALRELARYQPDAVAALERLAARASGDVTAYADLVDSLKTRRHLDYWEANEHGREAHAVVDELSDALSPTTAAALLPLLETAIRHLIRVVLRSDDSSGIQSDAARRLIDLHAEAAALARPDPVKLARWLVKVGIDEQDFWELDVVRYAEVLGARGLATYRKELDKRLAKEPVPYLARRGLQRLAVLSGDVAEIVRQVGGDLGGPHAYQAVVQALLEAGHPDEALRYALEGVESRLVPHQTAGLYNAAVELLRERGDREQVLRLRREQLHRIPNESSYSLLRKAAEPLERWPDERLSALDVLLEHNPSSWLAALLSDGEVALAWESSRGMERSAGMELALLRARARTHPADVFDPYVALVDAALVTAGERHYRQAVVHLDELRHSAGAAGLEDRFAEVVRRLIEEHQRRPTLVRKLSRFAS